MAEAGVSRELIFQSLEKQFGTDRRGIIKLQEAGKIGAEAAIEAFEFAILKKTNTKVAGQAGEDYAKSSLQGMQNVFATQREAFSLDIAERAKPAFKAMSSLLVGLGKKLEDTGLLYLGGAAHRSLSWTIRQ